MTLRYPSVTRTYTYILSGSANLQIFLERGGQVVFLVFTFSASVIFSVAIVISTRGGKKFFRIPPTSIE